MSQGTQINNLSESQQADQLMDLGKKTAENQLILPPTDQNLFQRQYPLLNRIDELEDLLQTSHKKISS